MKQRIIATILLLVTVLTMLASCVNYAFAEDSMENYVTLNLDELMKALHSIEIEEEDFGPSEKRDEIVVEEVEVTDEEGNTKTEEKLVRYIYVTMHSMDYLEAAELYGFDKEQMEILEAMMDPEFDKYYAEIIGIVKAVVREY
jgi:hypothetical protein